MLNTNINLPTLTSSVLQNDTVSSCSTSKVQEKTQLSRSRCMNSLREVKSQFKILLETLQDFGTVPIFKTKFSQDLDLLEQHLTKEIISQTNCKTLLTKLRTTFKNAFNSEFKEPISTTQDKLGHDEFQERKWIMAKTPESKINTGKAVDADLVDTESIRTDLIVQDESSKSGNDIDDDDADIRPIYDEEPMAKVQLTTECNIFAIGQQHIEQPKIINEGRIDQYPEQCQGKSPMLDSSPDNQTTDYSKQSLEPENILLKKTVT
ncbi:hypothetical protein Tco_1459297 [Tanacetum coccineum]